MHKQNGNFQLINYELQLFIHRVRIKRDAARDMSKNAITQHKQYAVTQWRRKPEKDIRHGEFQSNYAGAAAAYFHGKGSAHV